MKKNWRIKQLALLLCLPLAIVIAGCGDDPFTPTPEENIEPPAPEIKTPIKMKINSVQILDYPAKKTNGDDWDWDPFSTGPRRPDIYCQFGNHETNTAKNLPRPTGNVTVKFEGGYCRANLVKSGGGIERYWINMYDEDGTSADDVVDSVSLVPYYLYKRDNATTFDFVLDGIYTDRTLRINGEWLY